MLLVEVGRKRRFPHCASVQEGESLSSWVDRTAALLDLQRRDAWLHLGLIDHPQGHPVAYGVDLCNGDRRSFSTATGLPDKAISRMLLRSYDGVGLHFEGLDLSVPRSVRSWARTAWAYIQQSHACPACVAATDGVWRVEWKLPWTFTCVEHRRYLSALCPDCGQRWQSNVLDRRQRFLCCSSVPDLTRSRLDGRPRLRRHTDDICEVRVAEVVTEPAGAGAVDLQRKVSGLLGASGTEVSDAARAMEELRRLMPLAFYLGVPGLLADADEPVQARFTEHVTEREEDVPRRGADAVSKYRAYSLPPTDPTLVAGALTVAARLAFADDLDDAWAWFVDRVHAELPGGRGSPAGQRWTQLGKFWSPPPRHAEPLRRARDRRTFAVSAALDGRSRHARARHAGLSSRHVPALLWSAAYDEVADGLIDGGWPVAGRRFTALALARTVEPTLTDWAAATTALGVSGAAAAHCYALSSRLRQSGTGVLLEERLEALATQLARVRNRIDYSGRRLALAELTDLDAADWAAVCRAAGVDPTQRYWAARRRQAATWLWATLTGGDWHDAPALQLGTLDARTRRVVSNGYVSYFTAKHLLKVEEPLRALAGAVLERHGLDGPVDLDVRL